MSFFRNPLKAITTYFNDREKEAAEKATHLKKVAALGEAVENGTPVEVAEKFKAVHTSPRFSRQHDWNPQILSALRRDDVDVLKALLPDEKADVTLSTSISAPEFYYASSLPLLSLAITNGTGEKKIGLWLAQRPETDIEKRGTHYNMQKNETDDLPLDLAKKLGPPTLVAVLYERTADLMEQRPQLLRAKAAALR